jgi:hypothetical protein
MKTKRNLYFNISNKAVDMGQKLYLSVSKQTNLEYFQPVEVKLNYALHKNLEAQLFYVIKDTLDHHKTISTKMKPLTKEIHSKLISKLETKLNRPYYSNLKNEPRWKLQNAFNVVYNDLDQINKRLEHF